MSRPDIYAVKIKYPPDNQPPRQVKAKESGVFNQQQPGTLSSGILNQPPARDGSPPKGDTPQSVRRQIHPSTSMDSLARATSPPSSSERLVQLAQAPPLAAPIETRPMPRSESQDLIQAARPQPNGAPPQRPRREGDEDFRRAMSPTGVNGPTSPIQSTFPVRVTSPPGGGPASPPSSRFNANVLGTRSPSPRLRMAEAGERPAPPPDAFYYSRSPTSAGFGGRPNSVSGSAELVRELKAKDGEVEAGKKREAALRIILGKAVFQGFVSQDQEHEDLPNGEEIDSREMVRKLTDALVRLKQEKATIQVSLRGSEQEER